MGGRPALSPTSCSEPRGEDGDEEDDEAAVAAVTEEEEDEAVREGTASDCKKFSTCPPKPVTGN